MNLLLANGRYIGQWETPISQALVLGYGRDQIKRAIPNSGGESKVDFLLATPETVCNRKKGIREHEP